MKKISILGAAILLSGCTAMTTLKSAIGGQPNSDLGDGYTCTALKNNPYLVDYCINYATTKDYPKIATSKMAWVKLDFVSQNNSFNAGYITTIQHNIFNCSAATMGLMQYTYYDEDGNIVRSSMPTSMSQVQLSEPMPDSVGDVIMKKVCDTQSG